MQLNEASQHAYNPLGPGREPPTRLPLGSQNGSVGWFSFLGVGKRYPAWPGTTRSEVQSLPPRLGGKKKMFWVIGVGVGLLVLGLVILVASLDPGDVPYDEP